MKEPFEDKPFVMPKILRDGCPKCGKKDSFVLQVERVFITPIHRLSSDTFTLAKSESEELSRNGCYRFDCEECSAWFAFLEDIEANQVWSFGA